MNKRTVCAWVLLGCLAAAAPAQAQWRARVYVNGLYALSSIDYSETRRFTEFAEEGSFNADYSVDKGPGFEGGLQYNITQHFGLATSFALTSRDASASFDARLPHPLLFDRFREVQGELTGLSYKETAIHFSLVYTGSSGSLDYFLFGGGSLIKVETDFIQQIQYSHAYPYDEVTLTGTPTVSVSDRPFGFHVGAGLDYRLAKSFGLGVQARFSRATAELVPVAGGSSVEVSAGGFDVGVGLRVYF
jgi:opacity protein-like surface antigen